MGLRNIQRIGSKLTRELKIQLVHSCVLSHLDYCNSVLGSISELQLHKLQKVQNSAVRFIYGFTGKQRSTHLKPYLKELHFLPVRQRIMYKIALLVFKCLNGMAPQYMCDMIKLRNPNSYHTLRTDSDKYLLELCQTPNLKRTYGAFSVVAPKTWNELPYSIRSEMELNSFKKLLKTFLFDKAFSDCTD